MRSSFFLILYADDAIALEHDSFVGGSPEWTLIHLLPRFASSEDNSLTAFCHRLDSLLEFIWP
jgi:hypothetical protein